MTENAYYFARHHLAEFIECYLIKVVARCICLACSVRITMMRWVPVQRDYVVLSKLFIQRSLGGRLAVYTVTCASLHYTMDYGVVQPVSELAN